MLNILMLIASECRLLSSGDRLATLDPIHRFALDTSL